MGPYAPTGSPQAVMGLPPQAVMGLTQVGDRNLMRQAGPDYPPKTPTTTSGQVGSGQVTAGQVIRLPEKKSKRIRF